jgi:hypothetical protein
MGAYIVKQELLEIVREIAMGCQELAPEGA